MGFAQELKLNVAYDNGQPVILIMGKRRVRLGKRSAAGKMKAGALPPIDIAICDVYSFS